MSHALRIASIATMLTAPALVLAQTAPELPQPSPKAQVMQRVGLTDITVAYSSPGVKGRTIWGKLVPYGELWRAGANEATTITFTHDVKFGGKPVKAGTYAFYAQPTKTAWTLVLNQNAKTWGTSGYDKAKDVARVPASLQKIAKRERMTFAFSETTDEATRLDLEWDTLRVSVAIETDTKNHALSNIEGALEDGWAPYARAANYLMEKGDLTQALTYADTSIAIKGTWWNHWVKAQVLGKQGRKSEAVATAQKAQNLGGDSRGYNFYKKDIAAAVASWKR